MRVKTREQETKNKWRETKNARKKAKNARQEGKNARQETKKLLKSGLKPQFLIKKYGCLEGFLRL